MWHWRPLRDPPPFMANAILNFHFDFLHPSLILYERGCGERLKDITKMKRHYSEKCPIKLPCPTCSEPFSTQWQLKRHMNCHTLDLMDVDDPPPAQDPELA